MTAFTDALLTTEPAVPGLDKSIVVSPRRMHLTLGVMSLSTELHPASGNDDGSGQQQQQPSLQSAIDLLQELKPRIMEALSGKQLCVELKRVDIMKPERGSLEKAHVLWTGPTEEGEDAARLKRVCNLIHNEFKKAGLVVDEGRPLKLHCTILNTTYRRPHGKRTPFSYTAVLASPAFRAIEQQQPETSRTEPQLGTNSGSGARGRAPIAVNLGSWMVDEVQICEMGSWGPEGEYVSVCRCRLD
ncbi:hypothetical protein EIP91_006048 [Steccherinum ochraceum]|uniref:A-kinase anchor protein 7-like phosphoesterase domain-containing protein n=1 Tax=Steccherinum ochraceum TaxID=92696 RepID=A0A4R0R6B7_9APHY|nr:hypothetical protein EIP91_006048 [Steccherinum ochraceum]